MSDQTVKPLALEDFAPAVVAMRIELEYGRVLEFPVKMLTWHEWNEIGGQVPDPNMEDPQYKTRWNEAKKQKEFDPQNEDYLRAKNDAIEQRKYRRTLKALQLGGNDVVRGDTIQEQIDNFINALSIDVAIKLVQKLGEMTIQGRVSVTSLADSFRNGRVPANEGEGVPPEGLDAGAVG